MNRADVRTPRFICLTPTRNESWIIRHFVRCATRWADNIIIADQCSTDDTREAAQLEPRVDVILNDSPKYDEAHRQKLLISRARKLPGKRILIALDADEALSSDCLSTSDWKKIQEAAPGTVLRFRWVNVLPDFKTAWIPSNRIPCGFVDDDSEHAGTLIHSTRIPTPPNAPVLDLDDVVVLHFQFISPSRVESKHRWYQAWEHVTNPAQGALKIFRQYNHMRGSWHPEELQPMQPTWLASYEAAGIDYRTVTGESVTWWDQEVLRMLRQHGPRHFSRIAIWSHDWNAVAARVNGAGGDFGDPRPWSTKAAHRLLASTQSKRDRLAVRALEKMLRSAGW